MQDQTNNGNTAQAGVKVAETQVSYPYSKSELVTIQWKNKKPLLPELGVVGETARDYSLVIGASYAGPNSGVLLGRIILSAEEERAIMPGIVGVQPTHQEWDRILNEYWANIFVKVPYDGLILETGLVYESETKTRPIKPADYVLHKYCLAYPQVANDISLINNSNKIRFYLMKESFIQDEKLKIKRVKDLATKARFELENDVEKMKSLIILSNNQLPKLLEDQQLLVATLAEQEPEKFLKLFRDKQLMEKSLVERFIRNGLMSRPMNSTLVMYDGAVIGNNLEEAVAWLNMPANSEALLSLRQRLEKKELG